MVSVVVTDAFNTRPPGSVPAETDHVPAIGAVNVPELYAAPTVAFGNVVGVSPVTITV
jgi:hypothetical protein